MSTVDIGLECAAGAALASGYTDSKVPVVVAGVKKVLTVDLKAVTCELGHAAGGTLLSG